MFTRLSLSACLSVHLINIALLHFTSLQLQNVLISYQKDRADGRICFTLHAAPALIVSLRFLQQRSAASCSDHHLQDLQTLTWKKRANLFLFQVISL